MTDETKTLSEDEQFAALMADNPLFGSNAPKGDTTADGAGASEADEPGAAAAAAAGGADEGQQAAGAQGADASAQAAAAAQEGAAGQEGQGAGQAASASNEPFPGYSTLSQEAREAFDRLAQARSKVENDYKALHGMMAPTQRQNAELRRQLEATQARIQQLEQLERAQRDASAAKDEALKGIEDWASQFPEESKVLMALVNPLREKVTALEGQLNAARAELGTLANERQQAALAREISELDKAHADWRDIHASPDYWEWLNRQPPGIQALNESMFAGDAISLLHLYKSSRHAAAPAPAPAPQAGAADAIQQRRSQALARSAAPAVRGPESAVVTGGNQTALSDDDAAFLSLVGKNPLFR
jgi:predicted  nucleic acid-binding Zn-ribbon protein